MTKYITYYINNIKVSAGEFYETDFSDVELELLFQGTLLTKDDNEYRIFVEETNMRYDNNFYRQFNKKNNKKNVESKKTKKSESKEVASTKTSKPQYRYTFLDDFEYADYLGIDMTKKLYYIAYGSNLNKGQMKFRCPHAVAKYKGLLTGWELFYAGSKSGNYATIRRCEGKAVPVAIWEIDGLDEYYLDAYEGYPTFYFKQTIKFIADDEEKEAMVYIMRTDAKEGVPSTYYEDVVRQGYKDFGFDEKYLDESIANAVAKSLVS